MSEKNEYKPSFRAWIFAVVIAAGFGDILAEGVKASFLAITSSSGKLELRIRQCNSDEKITTCNFYIENTGDESIYITSVTFAGIQHPTFYSNNVIPIELEDAKNPIQRGHVAIAEPEKMLMVALKVPLVIDANSKACFINLNTELLCV